MLRPLVVVLLAFLAGLLPALRFTPSPLLPLVVTAALLAGSLLLSLKALPSAGSSRAEWLLLLAFAGVGAAHGASSAASSASDCRLRIADGAAVQLRGVLGAASLPAQNAAGLREAAPLLPVEHGVVQSASGTCRGATRVRLPPGAALPGGTVVEVTGRWTQARRPVVSTAWPQDPTRSGFVVADTLLAAVPSNPRSHPLLWLRGRAEWTLLTLFPRHFPLVDALLLGRRERMDPAVQEVFANSGLAHLLAISGMHVGLLAGAFLVLGAASRLPRKRVIDATLALTWLYLAMIGAPASAVRAGVMISLALLAARLQRPSAGPPMIAAAALVILAITPAAVLQPGFQLSFAGVVGIVAAHAAVGHRIRDRVRHPASRAVAQSVLVSAAAFVATAPFTVHHFGTLAPVAVLANLPAIPLTGVAVAGTSAALLVAPLSMGTGRLLADGAGVALDLLGWMSGVAAAAPLGHATIPRPDPSVWGAAALCALVAFLLARGHGTVRVVVAIGAATALFLFWPTLTRSGLEPLELHFLDVGQGDAVAIRSPAGRWILVDAGPRSRDYDAGERRVLPFFHARGVGRLEAMILTHPDADHIGGAAAVLRAMEVRRVVEPGLAVGKDLYLELLQEVERQGVPWSAARAGRVMTLDGMELRFLWPDPAVLDSLSEANQISAVVQLRYGAFSALLPGDAPAEAEAILAARHGSALRAQVLKAGHHGSRTSTSDSFLRVIDPQLVVISAGRRNRYGHPSPEVLRRLEARGLGVARTDRDGTVSLRVDARDPERWWRVQP